MIKFCVTLNKLKGKVNIISKWYISYHVWGSRYRAKFEDEDFDSFWGIACEGHTHTHTDWLLLRLSETYFKATLKTKRVGLVLITVSLTISKWVSKEGLSYKEAVPIPYLVNCSGKECRASAICSAGHFNLSWRKHNYLLFPYLAIRSSTLVTKSSTDIVRFRGSYISMMRRYKIKWKANAVHSLPQKKIWLPNCWAGSNSWPKCRANPIQNRVVQPNVFLRRRQSNDWNENGGTEK